MKTLLITLSLLIVTPCIAQNPPATKAQALAALSGASEKVLLWDPTMQDYNSYKNLTINYLLETIDFYEDIVKPVHGQQQSIETKFTNAQKKIKDPDEANVEDADSQIALAYVSKGVADESYADAATAFQEGRWDDCVTASNGCVAAYNIAYDFIGEATFYLGQAEEITSDAESDCFQLMGYQ